ncbi:uncharacterized protein LOC106161989 [Lingula anatina]|uniref:Uncharacterized protein LOC106161989 n=1 Tax=Lingula anatina TaxID=7574 RepID=A0A1S3I8K9_LINAN|nr:uncharacterized protein LOC106161989 [Lingula anatina]|eukprot:XP_013394528.1 uncharacterized protein LOC106161989 [Lingula anatina]
MRRRLCLLASCIAATVLPLLIYWSRVSNKLIFHGAEDKLTEEERLLALQENDAFSVTPQEFDSVTVEARVNEQKNPRTIGDLTKNHDHTEARSSLFNAPKENTEDEDQPKDIPSHIDMNSVEKVDRKKNDKGNDDAFGQLNVNISEENNNASIWENGSDHLLTRKNDKVFENSMTGRKDITNRSVTLGRDQRRNELYEMAEIQTRPRNTSYRVPAVPCVPQSGACKPHRSIVFLKVHKCGSETLRRVLQRAKDKYKLRQLYPKHGGFFYEWESPTNMNPRKITRQDADYHSGITYEVILNHMIFDYDVVRSMMPNHTFYLGLVREPFSHFKSAFHYYKIAQRLHMQDNDPVAAFLRQPNKYWTNIPKRNYRSFVRNGMIFEFGFPDDREDLRNNDTFISEYIDFLDKTFDFVIVIGMLDESLVLLRRMLCWEMEDILYTTTNKRKYNYKNLFDSDLVELHKKWSKADYRLYEHFATKLQNTIKSQGKDFKQELSVFRGTHKVLWKCHSVRGKSSLNCGPEERNTLKSEYYTRC